MAKARLSGHPEISTRVTSLLASLMVKVPRRMLTLELSLEACSFTDLPAVKVSFRERMLKDRSSTATRVSSSTIACMAKDLSRLLTDPLTKACTTRARNASKANRLASTDLFTKANSRTTYSMDRESSSMLQVSPAMKVTGSKDKCTALAYISGAMEDATRVSTRWIRRMASASTCGPMAEPTTACGRKAPRTEREQRSWPIWI